VTNQEGRGAVTNRLADATSPYLLQHKENPVDWWPWGDEAFEEARRLDRPVLLSVGYAACHWCHVMAHESFEDAAIAAAMNAAFVNVKVDREERPDVDSVYMTATQALTGHGGWPMTVFLTPDGRPFYAGTYFPPRPSSGLPSFSQVLAAIGDAWRDQREELLAAGGRIATALASQGLSGAAGAAAAGGPAVDAVASVLSEAVRQLAQAEDAEFGGFGGAPKFPPSMDLEFLIRHAATARLAAVDRARMPADLAGADDAGVADAGAADAGPDSGARARDDGSLTIPDGSPDTGQVAQDVAGRTLHAMARSGMYDQLAGGFARYAVDRAWVVPHFEKMLYDNALLARVYLHWWRLTGEPVGARVALETCDWMLAALRTAEGGLASSLDADTPLVAQDGTVHGVEGYTYVWTPGQLAEVLGDQDAAWAADLARVTSSGTFEHGRSTLQLDRDVWTGADDDVRRWRRIRADLLAARDLRPQPGRDDKVVAAWNGLAIAALAETGALLDRPDLVAAADRVADLLLAVHLVPAADGRGVRLRRVSRDGLAGRPAGVLEDYGDVAEGLLALYAVTGQVERLRTAGDLLDTVLDHFGDGAGGFHDTADDATDGALLAVRRPQDPTDNAYPSGTSAVAGALLTYAALTGSLRHRDAAGAALGVAVQHGGGAPRAFGWALAVAQAWADGPREVAVVGQDDDPLRLALHRTALAGCAPGLAVAVGTTDGGGVPLLAGRPLLAGAAAAYVCRDFACRAPTSSAEELGRDVGALNRT
jgi:uncharacterized protein YyaL (SSP411 family)